MGPIKVLRSYFLRIYASPRPTFELKSILKQSFQLQMLKMFAMQGPSAVECDINELRSFLDEKVRQHELIFSGGKYKLPKN